MRTWGCSILVALHLLLSPPFSPSQAFHHNRCTRKVSPQFQFPDCYLPPMDTSQLLSSASFVMSHDAATGYVKRGSLSASGLTWQYSKNQIGTAYQQLDDGARALDLRPKLLTNGTVIFQHGDINIPVALETVLADVVRWSADNSDHDDSGDGDELVLLLASNFAYQTSQSGYTDDDFYDQDDAPLMVSAVSSVYEEYNIPYIHCNDVYGLTIAEVMELAAVPTGGYILAMDGQDYYGTPCAKPNWVEDQLVSCYSSYQNTTIVVSCARQNPFKLEALKEYMLASANNDATDDNSVLGPPANLYDYPLNEIQALWQVTTASAVTGVSRLSSILDDNKKSNLNEELVAMIYGGSDDDGDLFNAISVLAVDNVALHGNAILSVLRTACGQSSSEECGQALAKPQLVYFHISKLAYHVLVAFYVMVVLWVGIAVAMAIRNREENPHPRLLWTTFQRLYEHLVEPPPSDNKKELLP